MRSFWSARLPYTLVLSIFIIAILSIPKGEVFVIFQSPQQFTKDFLIFFFLSIGESIKCWVCRSDGDPLCADPFDNTSFPISDCNKEKPLAHLPGLSSTMCRKVRQKVNGNWRYLRSCAWLGEPGIGRDERYCIHRSGTYNIHVEYCTCR